MTFLWVETQTEYVDQNQQKNATDQKRCELENITKLIEELHKGIDTTLFRNAVVDIGKEVIQVIVGIDIAPTRTLEKCLYQ
jgi:hypothetical protein